MTRPIFTYKQRLKLLERVYKKGVTVAQACREFGVSRFTFYKWAKRYNPNASRNQNVINLQDKKRKIKRFAKQVPKKIEEEVKKIASVSPTWSKYRIAEELKRKFSNRAVGVHGVYNILRRAGINTAKARTEWRQFVLGTRARGRTITPEQRLEIISRATQFNVSVAQACRDFGISRF